MPIAIFPRPSVLTSLVVAASVASGLAFGVMAASLVLVVARVREG